MLSGIAKALAASDTLPLCLLFPGRCKKGSGSHAVSSGETVVTYFFCGEEIPYRRTMKSHSLTLGHFKEQLRKKGNYRCVQPH